MKKVRAEVEIAGLPKGKWYVESSQNGVLMGPFVLKLSKRMMKRLGIVASKQ